MKTIWINAGELSGDMQAAALLTALREREPELAAIGMGGPNLARAGQKNLFRVESLSVMGIMEVLTALPRALHMLSRIKKEMARLRPDAVVLVDAPEFNFRVAKIAHGLGIPVYYFIPPKIWAWRTGRVRFLQRYVKRLFCILPFEPAFYAKYGVQVDYIGNPLVDMVNWPELKKIEPIKGRIGLMPGSRRKEVEALLPEFGKAARILLQQGRDVTFHCLRAPNMPEEKLRALWPSDVPVVFDAPEDRYTAMRRCECMLAASGTATLETALAGVPTVVSYRVAPFSALVGRLLIKVKWVSLTNLIMQKELFPELLQERATGGMMASQLAAWLDIPPQIEAVRAERDQSGGEAVRIGIEHHLLPFRLRIHRLQLRFSHHLQQHMHGVARVAPLAVRQYVHIYHLAAILRADEAGTASRGRFVRRSLANRDAAVLLARLIPTSQLSLRPCAKGRSPTKQVRSVAEEASACSAARKPVSLLKIYHFSRN